MSISGASSTWVLFVSVMQLVNGASDLNTDFLLVLFSAAAAAAVFGTGIVVIYHLLQTNILL